MNELAGKKAVMYGKIGEDFVFKKLKLFRSNNSHDALDVKGSLFSMNSTPVEIKSAQIFRGQFIFTNENHIELEKKKGYYIFVFMNQKKVLFCLKIIAKEIIKIKKVSRFKNASKNRRKNVFFRLPTTFFKQLTYEVV